MTELLGFWIVLNILCYVVMIIFMCEQATDEFNFSFVNPLVIYKHIKVNWFGAILLTILANVVFIAVSIPYWIYKLCTVGRKDEE